MNIIKYEFDLNYKNTAATRLNFSVDEMSLLCTYSSRNAYSNDF